MNLCDACLIEKKFHCRACRNKRLKVWRKRDPDRHNKAMKKWREKHPENHRANYRKSIFRRYGMTSESYDEMLAKQDNVCAICSSSETVIRRGTLDSLAIDHDHKCCSDRNSCGKCVRGLLCSNCNRLLGSAGDSIEILEKACNYLRKYIERRKEFERK